ncbi:ankyrin repeat domain-containing protein, partial [Gammaproteobacteria bacterium AH-315-E17]|nr:ankyrin repeat domain-containing protein [Gammaproteobacteria bacterium AH-315-E17]
YGATPLIRAARAGDVESVRLLLEYGALVGLPNGRGHTPLMVVSGIDWPAEPTRGRYKTEADSIEIIRLLLAAGADINALTGDPTRRPDVQINDANRGAGMQPAIRGAVNVDGQTALHAAAKMGWNQIVQYLIDNGATQQVIDVDNRTPIDLAMGRYQPAFLAIPPVPLLDTVQLLQAACLADDNCVLREIIDFSSTGLIQ